MNKYIKSVVAMLALVMIIASCGSDDPSQSEADRVKGLLTSGAWKIQSVSIDDVDKTPDFNGLQLTFTGTSFTAANGAVVWPASGTWTFTSPDATAFNRNDGVTVFIDEVAESKLVLTFPWSSDTLTGGKKSSVGGKHTFTFSK